MIQQRHRSFTKGAAQMPVDNDVYNRDADKWRDPNHFLSMLVPLAIPRVQYVHRVLTEQSQLTPKSIQVLDLGCGGGLVAEEMAQLGYCVTGIDPSERSIAVARAQAHEAGLAIDYRNGAGESLPFERGTFDAAYCLDVLEHVSDVEKVIAEIQRVLKPGGLFVFDTINRTLRSKLLAIKIMQDWQATSVMPPNFHDWGKFIKPAELRAMLVRQGLEPQEFIGFAARGNPLKHIEMFRKRKQGVVSFGEVGSYMAEHLAFGKDMSVSYAGFARKATG
jgi:2-polyprenyl-6-hydroxyphenyl methylase / 3-demethylubiquinone-9 3-methyltransferase